MSIPIKTNQLQVDIDFAALDQKYDVFRVETTECYFNRGAYILDAPLLCNNVRSVYFDSGKCFYVLMLKNPSNKTHLKEVLLDSEDGDKITLTAIAASTASQRVLLSLLLNAIG